MMVQVKNKIIAYADIIFKLGLGNVTRVVIYKIALRAGYYRWKCPLQPPLVGPFFISNPVQTIRSDNYVVNYFSRHSFSIKGSPDWFSNPWKQDGPNVTNKSHWSDIADFSSDVGDIKTIWELSRFDWMPKMACQTADGALKITTVSRIETWMRSWVASNQPNQGINWKCGQEVSLRSLNVLLTTDLLTKHYNINTDNIALFFSAHIKRIIPTILYAKAQNNNHGTSEAAALFCIGLFLKEHGDDTQKKLGSRATRLGRSLLENRVRHIILNDGSFSQLSVNYHRLMLDTITYCEIIRRSRGIEQFSNLFYTRMQAATKWLTAMSDSLSGDAANLGANDGAYFANLDDHPYRDFRPSLKRSTIVFFQKNRVSPVSDALLDTYAIKYKQLEIARNDTNHYFPEGGFARINLPQHACHFIFRYPKYTFRPSHCDANHIDIWVKGQNLTLDAGSYSYNTEKKECQGYFAGTDGHCTVKFDDRDQMPKLGRMLRGYWLQPALAEYNGTASTIRSRYEDYLGAWHQREVSVTQHGLLVKDKMGGFNKTAVLRWRLPDIAWTLDNYTLDSPLATISLITTSEGTVQLCKEKNSLHYLELHNATVFKLTLREPGVVETQFYFKS